MNKDNSLIEPNNNNEDEEILKNFLSDKIKDMEISSLEEKRINKICKKHISDLKNQVDTITGGADEKIKFILSKYNQLYLESQKNEKTQQKITKVHTDNYTLTNELNRVNSSKNRLESIARELQKRNSELVKENKRISEDEESKRDTLNSKFNDSMKEISSKIDEYNDQRDKHSQVIGDLNNRIQSYSDQYELREKQFNMVLKAKEIEKQVLESKLKHQVELASTESMRVKAYQEQIEKAFREEYTLKSTVSYYEEKFKQFQEAITKSNEVFANFKSEIEKMSKLNRVLEKDNQTLKQKSNQSDKLLIEMAEERVLSKKSIDTLKNLCRSLTNERTELRSELKKYQDSENVESNETLDKSNIINNNNDNNNNNNNNKSSSDVNRVSGLSDVD